MKLIIADTGAIISLGHVGQIDLIEKVFGDFYIAQAVWEEIQNYENQEFDDKILMTWKKGLSKSNQRITCQ